MIKNIKNEKGFTLIEILFALFIGLLLLSTVYFSMIAGQKSSAALEDKVVAQQDVRAALELMAMEIGMASYNPNFVSNIWLNPGGCPNPGSSLNQAYKGIQEATPNSITLEMDTGESGSIRDNNNEMIWYVYDTANERITRETNCGGGQPFLGEIPGTQGRSVRVINNTLNVPMFRYFDGLGTEILAAGLPVGIPNIRRVEITLAVETEDIDPNTNSRRRMIYSTSVIPRNHAINL